MAEGDYMSEVMYGILNSLGLDEEQRQRRMRLHRMNEMILMLRTEHGDYRSLIPLSVGSYYEATTIDGLSSDADVLFISIKHRVIQDIEQWIPGDKTHTLMIEEENCYKSYVKIYEVSSLFPGPLYENMAYFVPQEYVTDKDGKLYLSSHMAIKNAFPWFLHQQPHGPAANRGYPNADFVLALPCDFFPRSALRWKERQTAETRSRVGESIINEADHCHIVPVGNKLSPNVQLEWRYSFTHIERRLVHAWNNVQYKLYVMMKIILKDLIKPYMNDPDAISSYHIKTIMFWMNEEYKREFFEISNFNQCLLTYLKNLADTLRNKSLPHYFIEGCNLYYNKIDAETSRSTHIIQEIIDTWPNSLLHIKIRKLGSKFRFVLSGAMPLQIMCDLGNQERRNLPQHEMPHEFLYCFGMMHSIKEAFYNQAFSQEVLSSLNIINHNVKVSISDTEIRNFIDDYKSYFLCNFAVQYLIKNSSTQSETKISDVVMAVTCIQRYVNNCCIDTRLKVAAYLVFTGDFQGGTVLLTRIASQMKPYTMYTCWHGPCLDDHKTLGCRVAYDNKPTLSEYFTHYIASAVEYTSDMKGHLPKALVYEMFRSTSVSPPPSHKLEVAGFKWHQYAIIQCPVFMYFLRYVIAKSKHLYADSEAAIDKMKKTAKQLKNIGASHCETNHNIIGNCHMERGDPRSAFGEYKKSLNVKKYDNAAIWQIAVLLRRNIRGDQ